MEFKLINPQDENGFIQKIEFNFEELKTELEIRLEKYKNLTYTKETLEEAKGDRAGLNKLKEAIESRRKEIKKLFLKPYDNFEAEVKELISLINEPIKQIDTQLQVFEDNRTTAKNADIIDFYNSVIGDLAPLLPLDKFFNPKWLNATYKIANIKKEIIEIIDKIKADLAIIADLKLDPELELQVKDKYLQTLDFGAAMAEKTRLENLRKALKKAEEVQEELQLEFQEKKSKPAEIFYRENKKEKQTPALNYIKFWAKGTKKQLIALRNFMKNNNIEYGGLN